MTDAEVSGLRERKKQRTRRHIADTAARLFAEHGYENVAVTDVARAAEVAEQTVYNYFATKEQLVTDRDQQVQERLCELIRARSSKETPAAAVRDFVLASAAAIADINEDLWLGELGHLAAVSPAVHRLVLEMTDRQATALAAVIAETSDVPASVAQLQGMALANVLQILIREAGRRTVQGESQATIADELHATLATLMTELDRWFTASPRRAPRKR